MDAVHQLLVPASLLAHVLPTWLYRIVDWPMSSGPDGGYALWSGIGLAILAPLVYLRRHNCHVKGCPFLIWKVTAAGDHVCRRHHPHDQKTAAQVLADHESASVD